MKDVMAALIAYLKTVSGVTDLTSTRIYGGSLPQSEIENLPRKTIALRYAGGPEEMRTHRVQQQRIDVYSYGEDHYEAGRVDGAVCEALLDIQRTAASDTLLHSAGYSGAHHMRDSDHGWEYVMRSAMIRAGETALS